MFFKHQSLFNNLLKLSIITSATLPSSAALALEPTLPTFPSAEASDPVKLGWMQGFPPPPERQIHFSDGSLYRFPQTRWSFSNWRMFAPTQAVTRGPNATVRKLDNALRDDLDAVSFTPMGSNKAMSWKNSLAANYTDAIIIMQRGKVIYEKYFGVTRPESQHIAFSVTKSFIGLLAETLIAQGALDDNQEIRAYLPELGKLAIGKATVRQVMDMTNSLEFSENYADAKSSIYQYAIAGNIIPRPADYTGAKSLYDYIVTLSPDQTKNGDRFAYRTVDSDILAWIVARASNMPLAKLLEKTLWQPLGAEQDAYLLVDAVGTPFLGGGLNLSLRDMARVGEMMRLRGAYNGQQIIPAKAIDNILVGADREKFKAGDYPMLDGWSYRSQWWISHNPNGVFAARGIHGQVIYIDPKAEMVIARFASHPIASNRFLDPVSLPAFAAISRHLMESPTP